MSDNPNQWYLSGDLSIDGNATLKAPDKGIYSLQLSRIDESGREHKWAFWHMNSEYRKNSLEIWEYKTDSSGKNCTGNSADGAMCAPRLVISEGGYVGIGTAMPKAKLHIDGGAIMPAAGDGDNAGILFPSDPGGGGGDKAWIRYYPRAGGGSSERTVLEIGVANDVDPNYQDDISLIPSGAVGIGTREPQAKLHVFGNSRIDGDIAILGKHALRGNDPWLRLNQDGAFSAGTHTPGLFAPMSLNVGGVGGWGNPGNGNAIFAGLIGNMGYSPQPRTPGWGGGIHTWDVEAEGSIWCANKIHGSNLDLAENYYSDMDLEAGDVVSFDPSSDRIILSSQAADRFVCGVISTAPGFVLNSDPAEKSGKKYPLALAGRVPCKVSDENGAIKRGDLLCSSSKPGYAMKASPKIINGIPFYDPGTIIGKALGSLESGISSIDVFVFLS